MDQLNGVRQIIVSIGDNRIIEMDYQIHRRKKEDFVIDYPEKDKIENPILEIEVLEVRGTDNTPLKLETCASFCTIQKARDKKTYVVYDNKPMYDMIESTFLVSVFALCLTVKLMTGETVTSQDSLFEVRKELISKYSFEILKKNK